MMSYYDLLARFYETEHSSFQEDFPLYERYAKILKGSILEIGCGTGRITAHLARQGFKVTGMDISAPMLEIANEKRNTLALEVSLTFIQEDMCSFQLSEFFKMIIVPLGTFNHLLSKRKQMQCLTCIHDHLLPEGAVIFDLQYGTLQYFLQHLNKESILYESRSKRDILKHRAIAKLGRTNQDLQISHTYEVTSDDKVVKKKAATKHHLFYLSEIDLLLRKCELQIVEIWGSYDMQKFCEDSDNLIIVCKRANFYT